MSDEVLMVLYLHRFMPLWLARSLWLITLMVLGLVLLALMIPYYILERLIWSLSQLQEAANETWGGPRRGD